MATQVRDPQGAAWVVRRRWAHRSVRWRGRRGAGEIAEGAELLAHGADIPVVGIVVAGLALLLMAIAAIVVIVPAVVFVVEVLVVIVIVAAGVIGRLLFGRPWTIEARRSDGAAHEWQVRGWRASRDQMLVVANQLRATGLPADGMRGAIHPAEAGD